MTYVHQKTPCGNLIKRRHRGTDTHGPVAKDCKRLLWQLILPVWSSTKDFLTIETPRVYPSKKLSTINRNLPSNPRSHDVAQGNDS